MVVQKAGREIQVSSFDTFELWWAELVRLAMEEDWPLASDPEAYREYFDDGDSPQWTLDAERDAADDFYKDFDE